MSSNRRESDLRRTQQTLRRHIDSLSGVSTLLLTFSQQATEGRVREIRALGSMSGERGAETWSRHRRDGLGQRNSRPHSRQAYFPATPVCAPYRRCSIIRPPWRLHVCGAVSQGASGSSMYARQYHKASLMDPCRRGSIIRPPRRLHVCEAVSQGALGSSMYARRYHKEPLAAPCMRGGITRSPWQLHVCGAVSQGLPGGSMWAGQYHKEPLAAPCRRCGITRSLKVARIGRAVPQDPRVSLHPFRHSWQITLDFQHECSCTSLGWRGRRVADRSVSNARYGTHEWHS